MRAGRFSSDVLDAGARLLAPFLLLFAAYVVAHGHTSPGGGFQGGVILAAGIILARLTRGSEQGFGPGRGAVVTLACAGVLLYAGVGLFGAVFGRAFLDYAALPLPGPPGSVRAAGSFLVELGVAFSVTAVMVLLFDALTGPIRED